MTSGIISLATTLATNAVFDSFIGDSKDVLAEALLCFGVSSISMDQDDVCKCTDEICISSIFPEGEDIHVSISHAADSIGLKEIPRYEVKIIEEDDWMKRAQVNLLLFFCSSFFSVLVLMLLRRLNSCMQTNLLLEYFFIALSPLFSCHIVSVLQYM